MGGHFPARCAYTMATLWRSLRQWRCQLEAVVICHNPHKDPLQFTARQDRKYTTLFKTSTRKVLKSKCLFLSALWIVSPSHFNISHLRWRLWLKAHYTCAGFSCVYEGGKFWKVSQQKLHFITWVLTLCCLRRDQVTEFRFPTDPGLLSSPSTGAHPNRGGLLGRSPPIEI